jgi:hypothetical protein
MDVIDSMIEACPYGLRGYGLDPFVTVHPGNSVAAVADYWVTHTHGIAEFEQRYPESCLRVRYEDLVADPQAQSELIFGFLGEAPVPSITAACFGTARPQFGPGDHKIWDTDQVHADSVGRGARVPAAAIPVTIVALMNSVLDKLGYEPVGEYWNSRPIPVLAGEEDQPAETDPAAVGAVDGAAALDEMEAVLVPHLAARLGKVHEAPDRPGETATSPTITATVPQPAGGVVLARSWRVDLATAIVSRATEDPDVDPDGMWGVIGEAKDWTAVLTGKVGLSAAMRRGCLRMSTPETDRPKQPVPLQYDPYAAVLTWLLTNVGAAPTADSESGLAAEAGRALVPAR